jgi:hypothetical protein
MYALTPYAIIWVLEKAKLFKSLINMFASKYPNIENPSSMFIFLISYFLSTTAIAHSFLIYNKFSSEAMQIATIFYILLILSEATILYFNKKWLTNSLFIFMLSSIIIHYLFY